MNLAPKFPQIPEDAKEEEVEEKTQVKVQMRPGPKYIEAK
jgi:hypothetical protein